MMYNILKQLIAIPSVSGRESALGERLSKLIAPYADEVKKDNLGNIIAFKKGTARDAKRLMLAAHMDEIGFFVTFIDEKGFVRAAPVGGINYFSAVYSTVVFENGVKGVIVPEDGVNANEMKGDKIYIDIGASDRKSAEKKVKTGDSLIIEPRLEKLSGSRIAGRPLDDKLGCTVLLEAARRCPAPANDTYYVFTVQEEVGCRGSRTAAFGIMPDYAVAFDVTGTGDTLGAKPMEVQLGGGAAIKIKDASVICDYAFVERLRMLAADAKIKHQFEILQYGGTDTSSMQAAGGGAVAGAISIPTRYVHSGVECADLKDADACAALAARLLETEL